MKLRARRRRTPLAWVDGTDRWHVSVPQGPAQADVAEAAIVRWAREFGAHPDWEPHVEFVRNTVGGFALYREAATSPVKTCISPFHLTELYEKGRCDTCLRTAKQEGIDTALHST